MTTQATTLTAPAATHHDTHPHTTTALAEVLKGLTMSLASLVTTLARPHRETHKVTDRVTGMPHSVSLLRRPLLDDLEDTSAATPTHRGSRAWASPVPFDVAVHRLKEAIRGDLLGDMVRLGVTTFKYVPLAQQLIQWHGVFEASFPNGGEVAVWMEQLGRWETAIRAVVEPRKVREVSDPCPMCGYTEVYVEDERRSMLTISYAEDSPAATTSLECQRCGVLATGAAAVAATLRVHVVDGSK